MGGWRPAGAKRVTVPYADTVLLMPTNMRTAAVEHRVGRGRNGAVLVTGVRMAQQPENATTDKYPQPELRVVHRPLIKNTATAIYFCNWRLSIASRTSDHFYDFAGQLGGQDGTDAFGHTLRRVYRCLSLDRSTVAASSYRGILRTLESIDLTVSERF
jgi:hypothetical protein